MSNIPTKPSFDQLHREWQNLTLADDFIFSRVLRDKRLCPNTPRKRPLGRFPATFTSGGLGGRKPPSGAGERGGFRRGKPPLPSRGVVPSYLHPHDDRTQKIFYNVSRFQEMEDPAIRSLMEYLNDKKPTDRLTRRLNKMVEELKMIEMGFTDYMAMRQHDLDCIRRGREQGISIGLERGAYQNKLETARSMLEDGLPVSTVGKYTSLPMETVEQLAREGGKGNN